MRHVGNQLRFHALVFKLVLHSDACRLGDFIDICSQSVKLATHAMDIFLHRNFPVEISGLNLSHTLLDYRKFLYDTRYENKYEHYHNRQSQPGCAQKCSCHEDTYNLCHSTVAFLESTPDSDEKAAQFPEYPYHNSAN